VNVTRQRDDWEQHWDQYADAAEVNPAQQYRRKLACALLEEAGASRSTHLLDVGSGQGDLMADLRQWFPQAELVGLELSQSGIDIARQKVPSANFIRCDLLRRVPQDIQYRKWAEFAVCSEVLEHLDEPEVFLRNLTAFLKPGCTLIVTVPGGGPMSAFDHHIGHRRHYRPSDLKELLHRSGFQVTATYGSGFPFFNLYRLAVILRGKKLAEDAAGNAARSAPARMLAAAFRLLFKANFRRGLLGWQTVAVARY